MNKYYFTFGSAGQIYKGGWIIVHAHDYADAENKFFAYYGDRAYVTGYHSGMFNYAFCYEELAFRKTSMEKTGNIGHYCWDEIV